MKGSIMGFYLNARFCVIIFCLICLTWLAATSDAVSCDSCGRECSTACGTKHFRTCCFNYLRKRSVPSPSRHIGSNYINDNNGVPLPSMRTASSPTSTFAEFLEDLLQHTKDIENAIQHTLEME